MRTGPALGAVVVAVIVTAGGALSGCTVGSGSGSAKGSLWVTGCSDGTPPNFGTEAAPQAYDLQPTFFAGEPIEDLSIGSTHFNRLIIRMQSSGLAIQYNDTLYFDILNSYEVARCVRGRTIGGQPDWKPTEPLYNNQTPVAWCDWSGSAFTDGGAVDGGISPGTPDAGVSLDGGMSVMAQFPRIRITPDTDLRSSMALLFTCPAANVSADASENGSGSDVSWIEFQDFGTAEQPDLSPEMRTAVDPDFSIDYGGRLRATFHLILRDGRVISATEHNLPAPDPQVGGMLDGYFDFSLERGRAAQAFP